jgi:hypothetical protein
MAFSHVKTPDGVSKVDYCQQSKIRAEHVLPLQKLKGNIKTVNKLSGL